jgi:hypothetical protein
MSKLDSLLQELWGHGEQDLSEMVSPNNLPEAFWVRASEMDKLLGAMGVWNPPRRSLRAKHPPKGVDWKVKEISDPQFLVTSRGPEKVFRIKIEKLSRHQVSPE